MPNQPYSCPRCGYSSILRGNINQHFYKKKKACPATANDIELTDTIKDYVLNNRIYKIKDEAKIITQTINYNNTMNNYVSGMDVVDKITRLANHKQIEILDFEDKLEAKYEKCVERLENDSFKYDYNLEPSDFMLIVDNLTKAIRGAQRNEFLEELNVVYDAKRKRINVYSGKWEEYLVANGIAYLVNTIIDYYLESYEIYLMRKIAKSDSISQVSALMKSLRGYYQFIACFEIQPFCKGKCDNQILYNKDTPEYDMDPDIDGGFEVANRFSAMYNEIYGGLTNTLRKSKQAEMLDIIKSNSKNNLAELDKDIIDLVNIDFAFKQGLFERGMIEA